MMIKFFAFVKKKKKRKLQAKKDPKIFKIENTACKMKLSRPAQSKKMQKIS